MDIPHGLLQLLSGLVPATRPSCVDRENLADHKITNELNAALEVDVLILSFCLETRSLLRSMTSVGWSCTFLLSSALVSSALERKNKHRILIIYSGYYITRV